MKIYKILILALILASFSLAYSQEDVLRPNRGGSTTTATASNYKIGIGIEAGINYNLYSSTMEWQWDVPQSIYNVFKSASGISPYFGLALDFPIDSKIGFQAKVAYDMRSYSNSYSGIHDCAQYDNTSGALISIDNALMDADVDTKGADLSISAMLRYNITNDIVITLGPMFSIPVGDYEQKVLLTSKSDGCYFSDEFGSYYDALGNPYTQSESTTILNDIKARVGIDFGLGYNIPISDGVILTPQVRLNYFFTKAGDDESGLDNTRDNFYNSPILTAKDKTLNALKFGVALWF